MQKLQNIRGIFLDVGWTLCRPATGSWVIPLKALTYTGWDVFDSIDGEKRVNAFRTCMDYMDENHLIFTEEEDLEQFRVYYRMLANLLPELQWSEEQIEAIAQDKVFNMENYIPFEDTKETVKELSKRFPLGVISDTWPSIRHILQYLGVYKYFDSYTYSCNLGVTKPDPRMYEHALKSLGIPPENTLFVDDFIDNLHGARRAGIQPVMITVRPDVSHETEYPKISAISGLLELL